MNNQFFGDERDFYKYALLRILAGGGDLSIGVCWMLTKCGKTGGGKLAYLREGRAEQEKDPELHKFLHHWICKEKIRDVQKVDKKIIPGAEFFADEFLICESKRKSYWKKFIDAHGARCLLFFDPDTGIKPDNPKNADEYIRMGEIERIARECEDSSLIIFQYFRFPLESASDKKRAIEQFCRHKNIIKQLREMDGKARVLCLYKHPVSYYFLIRKAHEELIIPRIATAEKKLGFCILD